MGEDYNEDDEKMSKVLHIEITRMNWKGKTDKGIKFTDLLRIKEGDINGSIECSGITKAEAIRQLSDWIDSLYERRGRA